MNDLITQGFMDELDVMEKEAAPKPPTYPFSRLTTSRKFNLLAGGGLKSLIAGNPLTALLRGGGGALATHLKRFVTSRATRGRLRKGGKGLWKFEKKRLADASGLTTKQLEKILPKMKRQAKAGKKKTYPISRALTHSALVAPVGDRWVNTRALAGRKVTGGRLMNQEKALIEDLKGAAPGAHKLKLSVRSAAKKLAKKIAG